MSWIRSALCLSLLSVALVATTGCKESKGGGGEELPDTDVILPDTDEDTTPPPPPPPTRGGFLDPCKADKDCESGLCIDNLKGQTVCSVRCEDKEDCEPSDFRCSIYDSSGSDTVRACLPLPPTYCMDCGTANGPDDSKCQGYGARCVYLGDDGYACGRDCSVDESVCPAESECESFLDDDLEEFFQCVPTSRICSGCIDRDGDGYGTGDDCRFEGFDCDDTNSNINPGAEERCDDVDHDCDGDPYNGFDLSSDPNHCGLCETSCHKESMAGVCEEYACLAGACDDGHYNLDGDYATGCEYHCIDRDLSITDVPDDDGFDTNCDGIDGDIERAVFVSSRGNDDNDGTRTKPVRNLARALTLAGDLGRDQILITEGNYNVSGGPLMLADGISLYGGYSPDFSVRNVYAGGTNLRSTYETNVMVPALSAKTILSGLVIHGANKPVSGTSVAVYATHAGTEWLTLEHVAIHAGDGADGKKGNDGAVGLDGVGGAGAIGANSGTHGAGYCGNAGGNGGATSDCRGSRSQNGTSGSGIAPGSGGGAGYNYCFNCSLAWHNPHEGGGGGTGSNGGSGTHGTAPSPAVLVAGQWSGANFMTASGNDGGSGTDGSGGGGGGAGGAAKAYPGGCGPGRAGGGGGGGGGGGCAGTAGAGGTAGGGSFGLVIAAGTPSLRESYIYRGQGGEGGAGGRGGRSGQGGPGGYGSAPDGVNFTEGKSGPGGTGGQGGNGGAGAGGGGACGGPSIGVALLGTASLGESAANLIFAGGSAGLAGAGGQGGFIGNTPSTAPSGPAGCTGTSADVHAY